MESSGIYYLLARETDYRIRAKMAEECQVLCERNCLHEHFTPPSIHKNKPTIVRFSRVAIFNPPPPHPPTPKPNKKSYIKYKSELLCCDLPEAYNRT